MPGRRAFTTIAVVLVAAAVSSFYAAAARADGTVSWTGQGSDSVAACKKGQSPYLHWIFTTGGRSSVTSATLTVTGDASGGGAMSRHGHSWTLDTPYSGSGQPTGSTLSASVAYTGSLGRGHANLVISDGCYGPVSPPKPTISFGYADNYASHGTSAGLPWDASYLGFTPTYVIGCGADPNGGGAVTDVCPQVDPGFGGGDEYDSGAILIDNTSADPMSVTGGSVTIGTCDYNPWPGLNISIPAGGSLVLTQTGGANPCITGEPLTGNFNFDTSESAPFGTDCSVNDGLIPVVSLTIDGVATTIDDTGQILNSGGTDPGDIECGTLDEFHGFVQVSP